MQYSDLRWRKSSRSRSGDDAYCVEMALDDTTTLVRDSKNKDGGNLVLSAPQFAAFLEFIKEVSTTA